MNHEGRFPDTTKESDVQELEKLRDERLKDAQVDTKFVPNDLLL